MWTSDLKISRWGTHSDVGMPVVIVFCNVVATCGSLVIIILQKSKPQVEAKKIEFKLMTELEKNALVYLQVKVTSLVSQLFSYSLCFHAYLRA